MSIDCSVDVEEWSTISRMTLRWARSRKERERQTRSHAIRDYSIQVRDGFELYATGKNAWRETENQLSTPREKRARETANAWTTKRNRICGTHISRIRRQIYVEWMVFPRGWKNRGFGSTKCNMIVWTPDLLMIGVERCTGETTVTIGVGVIQGVY